jgi:hypothetical protein
MSDAPKTVFIAEASKDYVWIDLNGVALEVKAPDAIDMAYARGQAARVVAQIEAGFESSVAWGAISAEEAEEEESRKEVRDLVIATKLALKITQRWNVSFVKGSLEPCPIDEEHMCRLFKIPRMIEAFWLQVLVMGTTIEPAEGNDFAAAPNGDTDTAAKPADYASSKAKDAPLAAETASQESAAPKKRTRRTPK